MATTVVLLLSFGLGCGIGESPSEGEKELAELTRHARENSMMRHREKLRVVPIEGQLRLGLKKSTKSVSGCKVESVGQIRSRKGLRLVTCADLGTAWPFKVEYGFVRCDVETDMYVFLRKIIFATPRLVEFGLNGDAHSVGYEKPNTILKAGSNSQQAGVRIVAGMGLRLC